MLMYCILVKMRSESAPCEPYTRVRMTRYPTAPFSAADAATNAS